MAYWLIKSEPDAFNVDQLEACGAVGEPWDGVRNYQARNMMRDQMQVGDGVLFYYSNCAEPGIVALAEVASGSRPDDTAFDPQAKYFDPKSDPERPRWYLVNLRLRRRLGRNITLRELRAFAEGLLCDLALVRRGNRLSVMPVTQAQWDFILALE